MLFKKLEYIYIYIYIYIMSNSFVFINDNNELHKLNMNVTSNQNDLTFDNNLIINGNVEPTRLNIQATNDNIGGILQLNKGLTADANNTHDFEILNDRPNDNNRHLIIRGKPGTGGLNQKDFMKIGYFESGTGTPVVELDCRLALKNNWIRFGAATNDQRFIGYGGVSSNGIELVGPGSSTDPILKIINKTGYDDIIECYSDKVKINKELYVDGGGLYVDGGGLAVTSTGSYGKITITRTDAAIGGYMDIGMSYGDGRGATGMINVIKNSTNTSAPNFSLYLENSEKLTVLNNGNLGIGTISPSQKLDVNGDIKLSGNFKTSGNHTITLPSNSGTLALIDQVQEKANYIALGDVTSGSNNYGIIYDPNYTKSLGNSVLNYHTNGTDLRLNTRVNSSSNIFFDYGNTNVFKFTSSGIIQVGNNKIKNNTTYGWQFHGVSNRQISIPIGSYYPFIGASSSNAYVLHINNIGDAYRVSGTSTSNLIHRFVYGKVGIGGNPSYPLEVFGSSSSTTIGSAYFIHGGAGGTSSFGSQSIGAKFHSSLWISGTYLLVSSDRRIKTNIVDVPDNLALEQLRNIPCRYYEYIDKTRGQDKTIGFIAQEVKEVMPMCVSQEKSIIPDIYKNINCIWTSEEDKFIMSSPDLSNVNGIKYKFYVSNATDGSDEKEIEIIGNSDNTFTFEEEYTNVFCYGKEIDDFNVLDKQKLFTLNFSATQEIDRIQQTHITEIATLKKENETLKNELT